MTSDKSFSVYKVDNGWLLQWADSKKAEVDRWNDRLMNMPKLSGSEIFTDEKKLLERIESLLK